MSAFILFTSNFPIKLEYDLYFLSWIQKLFELISSEKRRELPIDMGSGEIQNGRSLGGSGPGSIENGMSLGGSGPGSHFKSSINRRV